MIFLGSALLSTTAAAQTTNARNFIRQTQFPVETGAVREVDVPNVGQQLSELAIDPGGARFDLFTVVGGETLQSKLLDTSYVGTYIPLAKLEFTGVDLTAAVPRIRADLPFNVNYTISGLRSGENDPEASKKVRALHHVQSYGINGTGVGIDRSQAIVVEDVYMTKNESKTVTFPITVIPGANRAKVRGEERFSFFSLKDYQAEASQLASQYIEVWPVSDGLISGLAQNQKLRYSVPDLTISMNDLYPSSTSYVQVYPGGQRLGVTGKIIPGSALVINEPYPQNRTLTLRDYQNIFDEDGVWTMELVTVTPFGTDRLHWITFEINRTLKLNGAVTTVE